MVYEPAEDSCLLQKAVEKYARGKVLDMGCGSGIQAITAKKKTTTVLAADIDPQAVKQTQAQGITAIISDKFSAISGIFDTIICNTPYLPSDPLAPDRALDGGKKGFEWTLSFIQEVKAHLHHEGQILLLISSATKPDVVQQALLKQGFVWEIVGRQALFFEELLVYRITWALPKRPQAEFFAKGKRSFVYRDGDHAIKVSAPRRAIQEAHMLSLVNKLGIGPKLYKKEKNSVEMEFIDGKRIDVFLRDASSQERISVIQAVLSQLELLDTQKIEKSELTNPYKHIIVRKGTPVLIDWERAKKGVKTHNVSQFREYIKKMGKLYPEIEFLHKTYQGKQD